MILGRNDQAEPFHAREMVRTRNEGVLECPKASNDGLFGIGCFVCRQNLIDGSVADRMSGDTPTQAVEFLDDCRKRFLLECIDTVIFAAFIVRLRIKLRHPAALETAVDGLLDAAEAQPLIAFVWFHVKG